MNLLDIVHREKNPKPWAEGEKIPWNDPEFSKRMLCEHLSQAHDAASRRFEVIDEHVSWIHENVLQGKPTRILDLACGPGLYASRLAKLGNSCVGIDFSPASIAYARQQAEAEVLDCTYHLHDIRSADYGDGYGLAMLIFGEFNVFTPQDARKILVKAFDALLPGGWLLLEPHTFEQVVQMGKEPASWFSEESGLFSSSPHLYLQENFWDAEEQVAIERYFTIDAATGEVVFFSSSTQAYTNEEYRSLLSACGFGDGTFYPALGKSADAFQDGLLAILSQKPAA
jgi:SAM-dependent methyltransferase